MTTNKVTRYNKQWEDESLYPEFASWVVSVPGQSTSASCKLCEGNPINLSIFRSACS